MKRAKHNSKSGSALLALCISTLLAISALFVPAPTSAAGDTLRIEPASAAVAKDATFPVRVVQNAEVPTSGAQATITFDPALLQITSVSRGTPYADAPVFTGAAAAAITAANTSGKLAGVAAAFLPPDAVPAGDRDFLVIEFKAIACGQADLGLPVGPVDAGLLDGRAATYGDPLAITAIGGSVTISCGGGSSPSPVPTITPAPSPSPAPTATPAPTITPRPSVTAPPLPAGNSLRIEPYYSGLANNATFGVRVVQKADLPTSGAQATITFDPAILQVVSVAKGTAYAAAPVFVAAGPAAIATANTSGRLAGVAAAFLPPGSVPAGQADFLVIEFRVIACGETELGLPVGPSDAGLLDGRSATYGNPISVATVGGLVTACAPGVTPTPKPTPTPQPTPTPKPPRVVAPPPPPPAGGVAGETAAPIPSEEPTPDSATPEPSPAGTQSTTSPARELAAASDPGPTPNPREIAVRNVAMVGLGVAGVVAGLLILLALATALLIAVVVPIVVVRRRGGR